MGLSCNGNSSVSGEAILTASNKQASLSLFFFFYIYSWKKIFILVFQPRGFQAGLLPLTEQHVKQSTEAVLEHIAAVPR